MCLPASSNVFIHGETSGKFDTQARLLQNTPHIPKLLSAQDSHNGIRYNIWWSSRPIHTQNKQTHPSIFDHFPPGAPIQPLPALRPLEMNPQPRSRACSFLARIIARPGERLLAQDEELLLRPLYICAISLPKYSRSLLRLAWCAFGAKEE